MNLKDVTVMNKLVIILLVLVVSCKQGELSVAEYREWCSEQKFTEYELKSYRQPCYIKVVSPECKVFTGSDSNNPDTLKKQIEAERNTMQLVLKIPKSISRKYPDFNGQVNDVRLELSDSVYYPVFTFKEESILNDTCHTFLFDFNLSNDFKKLPAYTLKMRVGKGFNEEIKLPEHTRIFPQLNYSL